MVSWNDAAEMKESVESDAFVIPSSSGRPWAGRPPAAITRSFSSMNRKRSTCSAASTSSAHHPPRADDDLAEPLHDAAVMDEIVDFRDDRGFAPLPRLEQLDHARHTARGSTMRMSHQSTITMSAMSKRVHSSPLSVSEIVATQARVLENSAALIREAELLSAHSHFARSFVLSVIAIEEASKALILLECAKSLATGEPQDWPRIYKRLNSHSEKLKANLLLFKSLRLGAIPPVGSAEWQDAVARVNEMNLLKQAALYVWIGEGGPLTTTEHIAEDDKARTAIALAKLSYNTSDLLLREFEAKRAGLTSIALQTRYP